MTRFLALLCLAAFATFAETPDPWKELRFLIGEWVGEGGGASTGQGGGVYSFTPDLGGKVLVRRNTADYPAANGKPAIHHEDSMTVYTEGEGKPLQAIYFDTEGHVIRYGVEADPAAKAVRFLSAPEAGQPRYRLTYRDMGKDTVAGQFEVAAPGAPDAFKTYLQWTSRRRK